MDTEYVSDVRVKSMKIYSDDLTINKRFTLLRILTKNATTVKTQRENLVAYFSIANNLLLVSLPLPLSFFDFDFVFGFVVVGDKRLLLLRSTTTSMLS